MAKNSLGKPENAPGAQHEETAVLLKNEAAIALKIAKTTEEKATKALNKTMALRSQGRNYEAAAELLPYRDPNRANLKKEAEGYETAATINLSIYEEGMQTAKAQRAKYRKLRKEARRHYWRSLFQKAMEVLSLRKGPAIA